MGFASSETDAPCFASSTTLVCATPASVCRAESAVLKAFYAAAQQRFGAFGLGGVERYNVVLHAVMAAYVLGGWL